MESTTLRLTVAICTWNRCASLHQTLESFSRLAPPARTSWELLVVNNNCTDRTDEVIKAFERELPIRRVFEPKAGLSHARNRAIAEATGDYILWTDDDVTVCREWLVAYTDAFREWPDAAIFGGPIRPAFEGTPPAWLQRVYPTIAGVYAARDFGTEPIELSPQLIPWGANYVIRAREQAARPYDPDLGYRPGRLVGWEESEVILALMADGMRGRWVPGAALDHHVPKARQTTTYLRTHFFNRGVYHGTRWNEVDGRLLFGRPRWLWRRAVTAELRYRLHRLLSDPEIWIEHLITSSETWGLLNGYIPKERGSERWSLS
jgi:glucosyl-dolichyl phosphate glucuronosyltransferase